MYKSTRLGCSVSMLLTLFCIIRSTITEHWCSLESYRGKNWRTWVMSQPYHGFARQISVGHVRSHKLQLLSQQLSSTLSFKLPLKVTFLSSKSSKFSIQTNVVTLQSPNIEYVVHSSAARGRMKKKLSHSVRLLIANTWRQSSASRPVNWTVLLASVNGPWSASTRKILELCRVIRFPRILDSKFDSSEMTS